MKLLNWGGLTVIACSAFVAWTAIRVLNAPSTEEAMQRSLTALNRPELAIVYSLHRDACSIDKISPWRWRAECVGVPQHFYRDTIHCESRISELPKCRPAAATEDEDCRSFFWDIDLDAKPIDSITHRSSHYASLSSECNPKGTFASEREEMARRGIRPVRVEINGGMMRRLDEP
ncbi:hypothetical protein [Bradyrhizobium sp. HKCCYLR20261]|uniref:hypothetical protein n=1 Tax=unclassified Bradyrhizobium TaxID=2631580 RepID=UPI003EC0AE49